MRLLAGSNNDKVEVSATEVVRFYTLRSEVLRIYPLSSEVVRIYTLSSEVVRNYTLSSEVVRNYPLGSTWPCSRLVAMAISPHVMSAPSPWHTAHAAEGLGLGLGLG